MSISILIWEVMVSIQPMNLQSLKMELPANTQFILAVTMTMHSNYLRDIVLSY
jgi:hypothetical protein